VKEERLILSWEWGVRWEDEGKTGEQPAEGAAAYTRHRTFQVPSMLKKADALLSRAGRGDINKNSTMQDDR
jgi:hypothetical protein